MAALIVASAALTVERVVTGFETLVAWIAEVQVGVAECVELMVDAGLLKVDAWVALGELAACAAAVVAFVAGKAVELTVADGGAQHFAETFAGLEPLILVDQNRTSSCSFAMNLRGAEKH